MEKIKQFITSGKGKDILCVIIVILVGLASFGLGRLSKATLGSGIKVEYTDPPPVPENSVTSQNLGPNKPPTQSLKSTNSLYSLGKTYFASSRGNKYYHIGCSGGKDLKEENKIYFTTTEEAERAGYELSSTCK